MKTEMKKNKKMVLALAVVAALAMVSVAAVALQGDDSDAAGTYIEMKTGNNIIVEEPSAVSYDFYIDEGTDFGALLFIVRENATFSGTLRIGTLSAEGVYTPYATFVLTNASAVNITAVAYGSDVTGVVSFFMIGNSSKDATVMPGGTYVLTQGQVMLGSATTNISNASWETLANDLVTSTDIMDVLGFAYNFFISEDDNFVSFNGTVSAGDNFSVTSSYVVGTLLSVTANGNARISGIAASPNEVLPVDKNGDYPAASKRTLSMSGTASIQYPEAIQKAIDMNMSDLSGMIGGGVFSYFLSDVFVTDSVNVTIEDGAVITAGDRMPSVAESVTIDAGAGLDYAFLIDSNGKVYEASSATPVVFEYIPLMNYTLVGYDSTNGAVYYGTATISGSGSNYTLSLGANRLSQTYMNGNDLSLSVDGNIEFQSTDFRFEFAINTDNNELGIVNDAGIIEFENDVVPGNELIVIMRAASQGSPLVFYVGDVNAQMNDADATITVVTGNATPTGAQIKAGTVVTSSAIVKYIALDDSTITVKGVMNFIYTSDTIYGEMDITSGDAFLKFEGTGIISQGVAPLENPIAPAKILGGTTGRVVAAYYFTNEGAPVTKSTYYFTTLANAITKNNEITLTGKHVILEDTTLDNPDFDSIRVILGPGAELEVGRVASGSSTPAISANLTIPSKTEVVVPSDAGGYRVINGQAIYDVMPTPAENEPQADVMIEGDKFIYTDIATALDISVSGDVLELRKDADLIRDATLKEGVELLDAPLANLTILEDIILTINGNMISTQNMVIEGTIRINGEALFTDSASATFGSSGAIDITSSGVLTINNASSINVSLPPNGNGTINVAGKIDVQDTSKVNADTISVVGEVLVDETAMLMATGKLVIGELPTLSTGYTNSARINGIITLDTEAVAYVYGNFAISVSGTNANLSVNGVLKKTEYRIENSLYVTLYTGTGQATDSNVLPLLYEDQLRDIIINDWNNERQLRGDSLKDTLRASASTAPLINDPNWEIVYADFEYRTYEVTFSYLQGMTWVVNGVNLNGGEKVTVNYGQSITVTATVQPGFEGTPVLRAGNVSYTAGTPYTVTGDVVFTASGVQQASGGGDDGNGGMTLIEYLLIVIVIIIAVIAIIVAIRLLRS